MGDVLAHGRSAGPDVDRLEAGPKTIWKPRVEEMEGRCRERAQR